MKWKSTRREKGQRETMKLLEVIDIVKQWCVLMAYMQSGGGVGRKGGRVVNNSSTYLRALGN